MFQKYQKELEKYENGTSEYVWDEIEELITDDFEEEHLTSEQFDILMRKLMSLECD